MVRPKSEYGEHGMMGNRKVYAIHKHPKGRLGLFILSFMMLFLVGGSFLFPLDVLYTEPALQNLKPSYQYLQYPAALQEEGILDIASGVFFSIGVSRKGNVYVWGSDEYGIKDIPQKVLSNEVVAVAAGDRHALALLSNNEIIGWGENTFSQAEVDIKIQSTLKEKQIKDLFASDFYSGCVTEDGNVYVWGNTKAFQQSSIPNSLQGKVEKVVATSSNLFMITKEHTLEVLGTQKEGIMNLNRDILVKDVVATTHHILILDMHNKLHAYGEQGDALMDIPVINHEVIQIASGRRNFYVLDSSGKLYGWGSDNLHALDIKDGTYERIFVDNFQMYGVMGDKQIITWGHQGFLLGSDEQGRDIMTRMMHGGFLTLRYGTLAIIISTVLSVIIGMVSAYYGKWIDHCLTRLGEVITCIPLLPIVITLASLFRDIWSMHEKLLYLMILIGCISWPYLARLIRSQILVEKEKEYILYAKTLGASKRYIMFKELLPSIYPTILVDCVQMYASIIFIETSLSFLGFGVQAPYPSWGNMLESVQGSYTIIQYWWRWLFPTICIFMTVYSLHLIKEALYDRMNVRHVQRKGLFSIFYNRGRKKLYKQKRFS